MRAEFDPVTLATPFFILTTVLEIVPGRLGKLKACYEPRHTAVSLLTVLRARWAAANPAAAEGSGPTPDAPQGSRA